MPAWATSPTQERFSGGMLRYQANFCSIRAIAALASDPVAFSRCRTVAVRLALARRAAVADRFGLTPLVSVTSTTLTRRETRYGRTCAGRRRAARRGGARGAAPGPGRAGASRSDDRGGVRPVFGTDNPHLCQGTGHLR